LIVGSGSRLNTSRSLGRFHAASVELDAQLPAEHADDRREVVEASDCRFPTPCDRSSWQTRLSSRPAFRLRRSRSRGRARSNWPLGNSVAASSNSAPANARITRDALHHRRLDNLGSAPCQSPLAFRRRPSGLARFAFRPRRLRPLESPLLTFLRATVRQNDQRTANLCEPDPAARAQSNGCRAMVPIHFTFDMLAGTSRSVAPSQLLFRRPGHEGC
jgi:hypothetical protein